MRLASRPAAVRKTVIIASLFIIVGCALAFPVFAQGRVEQFFTELLWSVLIWPFAQLLNFMVVVLIKVASYNSFGNEPLVIKGWTLTRNLANMFFVFILLVIAIGSIVKWPIMNYRQNLRRLILMALLINFSRTITLFMIDLSQVIMLTFLTAVQDALQGGVITLLGIDQVISNVGSQVGGVAGVGAAGVIGVVTFLLAAIMVLVAAIVVSVIVIILVVRIIALWVIIALAPVAFLASTLPQTEKYYHQWWDILGKNVVSGPILAFFLWLTFAVVAEQQTGSISPDLSAGTIASIGGIAGTAVMNFIIGIGMLVYSIKLAGSAGGAGGAWAAKVGQKGLAPLKSMGKALVDRTMYGKSGEGGAVGRLKSVALGTVGGAGGYVGDRLPKLTGSPGTDGAATTRVGRYAAFAARAVTKVTGAEAVARSVGRVARQARDRQMTVREKAEEKSVEGLSSSEQLAILEEKPWYKAFMGPSAPRRQAILNNQIKEFNKKTVGDDGKFNYKVSDDELHEFEATYEQSGATAEQLKQFRKATHLRGLKARVKAGDADSKKELDKLTIEFHQEGKLSSEMAESNPELAGRLMVKTKSVSQIKSWVKDMDSSAKEAIMEGYETDLKNFAKEKAANPRGWTNDQEKNLKKLKAVIAGQDSSRATKLVDLAQTLGHDLMDLNTVTTNADEDSYNDIISSSHFADVVHQADPAFVKKAMETQKVSTENKKKLIESAVAAANDPDPAIHVDARRAISAALNNEQTRQLTKDYLDPISKATRPGQPDPVKVVNDYEDEQLKQKAQVTVKKELADNIERFNQKYTKNQEVLAPSGKEVVGTPEKATKWIISDFDATTGEVSLTPSGKKGGPVKKMSLHDFSRFNKLY